MNLSESRSFAARLVALVRTERDAMAEFLVALAEFDRAQGWRALGYSGLFPFLNRELGLSKASSFFRMKAAELIQRFPEIVEPLRDGRICLTAMASISKVLTPANAAEVLPKFFHRSRLEAKAVVAELAPVPNPTMRTVVTTTSTRPVLPGPPAQPARVAPGFAGELRGADAPTAAVPAPLPAAPGPALRIEPLTPTVTRLHVSVSPAFVEKLESARLALSHSMPGASAEDILAAGLDLLLARDAKRKGLVANPRPAPPAVDAESSTSPGSAHVPAHMRREVWRRDGGRCQWPLHDGSRCGSRLRCELDHVIPRALGGPTTVANLRILCEVHNLESARRLLGDATVDRYRRPARAVVGSGPPVRGDDHSSPRSFG